MSNNIYYFCNEAKLFTVLQCKSLFTQHIIIHTNDTHNSDKKTCTGMYVMNTFKTTSQPQMPMVLGDTLIRVHRNFKRMHFRVRHCFKQSPVGKGHVEALHLQGEERMRDLPAGSSRSPFSTRQSTLDSSLGPSVSWDCHLDPAGSLWEAEASGGPVPPMRTCTISPSSDDGACQGS